MRKKTTIVINYSISEIRMAILESNKLVEYKIEHPYNKSLVGNIYKGRVKNIIKGLKGAFVNIGEKKNAFLPLSDIPEKEFFVLFGDSIDIEKVKKEPKITIKEEQDIICQVVKNPIGEKGARLTSQVSLAGRYMVLMLMSKNFGVSRRIRNIEERRRLIKVTKELGSDYGIIFRTASRGVAKKYLKEEYNKLVNLWENIKNKYKRMSSSSLLYEEPPLYIKILRDKLNSDVAEIYIDNEVTYKEMWDYLTKIAPRYRSRLKLYKEKTPIFEKFGIKDQIPALFTKKIKLPSGGLIIIDETEALISIDVNTGSAIDESPLKLALKTNTEAAEEIARQIRLRDLSGIIIIDFIDMLNKSYMDRVVERLKKSLVWDKAQLDIFTKSPFGLVDLTRERRGPGLLTSISEVCPVCKGFGKVVSKETKLGEIERQLRYKEAEIKGEKVSLVCDSQLYDYIIHNRSSWLNDIVKTFSIVLEIKVDINMIPYNFEIIINNKRS